MEHLKALFTSLRAFLIAAVAGGSAAHAQRPVDPSEQAAWDAARRAGTPDAFERYLELYPVGRYAEEAFQCVVQMSVDPQLVCSPDSGSGTGGGVIVRSITTQGVTADVY